tara:strand:+ start:10003 stop:11454 length:1452 start_codon:yes stop_codon:yes gene_type:complete
MADPILTDRLDLSTPDKARKALSDIVSEQKRLKSLNRDLRENVDKKAADMAEIQKRMTELENRGGRTTSGSNVEMQKYVRQDGSVRLKGENTRETAYLPGLMDDAPVCDWQQDLQKAVSDYTMVKTLSGTGQAPKSLARVQAIARNAPVEVQRIFADVSGSGQGWIPDEMLPTLERNLVAQRRVAAAFDTMDLPNKTTLLPFLSTGFRPYIKAAATADDPAQYTSSSMVTAQRTITATGFAVRAQVADDAEEDSIIAVLPTVRQELISAIIDGEEDAIINGDTSTHQDTALADWDIRGRWGSSGLGGSADHRRAWIGLRARAFDLGGASTEDRTTYNADTMLADRGTLDSPHGVDGSLIVICSPEAYLEKFLAMEQVRTMEKYPQPTIVSGELGQIYGMPIVISEFLSNDLQSTGLFTTAGGSTTGVLIVNRDRFKLGKLRGATVEVDKDITRGTHQMVATVRETFFTVDADSKRNVHFAYDV